MEDFAGYGVSLKIDPASLREVACRAYEEKTGARGLMTILERLFRSFKYELPSMSVRELAMTPELVENPEKVLAALRAQEEATLASRDEQGWQSAVDAFIHEFNALYGLTVSITEAGSRRLHKLWQLSGQSEGAFLREHFRDVQHGLRLICQHSNKMDFSFGAQTVGDPQKTVSCWLRDCMQEEQ